MYQRQTFTVYAKILTRSSSPTNEELEPAMKALEDCGIPRDAFVQQDQTNCTVCYDEYYYNY